MTATEPQTDPVTGDVLDAEVTYHGSHSGSSGPGTVEIRHHGETVGVLRHVVRHSPTGFSWGYGGSGPADLARSLLIDVLGADALCSDCDGTRKVVLIADERERPYDSDADQLIDPELLVGCICDGGYRSVPYQRFKDSHVAAWGNEWSISRAEVRAWLAGGGAR